MHKIKIKPLSINLAYRGRRFKTLEYKCYEQELLMYGLPQIKVPAGPLEIHYEFGMSKAMDFDNPVKPFTDVLQYAYDFNDNRIYKATILKVAVSKGSEYILFDIKKYDR